MFSNRNNKFYLFFLSMKTGDFVDCKSHESMSLLLSLLFFQYHENSVLVLIAFINQILHTLSIQKCPQKEKSFSRLIKRKKFRCLHNSGKRKERNSKIFQEAHEL